MVFLTLNWMFFILSTIFLITVNSHECNRRCATRAPRLKCHYDFVVTQIYTSDILCENNERNNCINQSNINSLLFINGQSPGPSIEACLGDTIEVFLHNKLSSQEISMHWHGIRHLNVPHMDGVTMISQCPILPFSSFRYDIKPENNGTYFYHAHAIGQQGDGLYGAVIIRNPDDDLSMEKLLMISALPSASLSGFFNTEPPIPTAITLNGKTSDVKFDVENNEEYRLRLINANVFNCPIAFSINEHTMKVKSIGDNMVKLTDEANYVIIFPGERLDIVLETNQPAREYNVILQGLHACKNLMHKAILTYNEAKSNIAPHNSNFVYRSIPSELQGYQCRDLEINVLCAMNLKNSEESNNIGNSPITYYIPFDINYYDEITDDMTEYSFQIYGFSYYPSYLTTQSTGASIAQINKMTFKYPSSPILAQPDTVLEDMICSIDDYSKICGNNPHFCECLQILPITPKTDVEIILIDEGNGGNMSHVFHVHGYSVNVVGFHHFERSITKEEVISLDRQGLLPRNVIDPPKMDTFIVPNKGYTILRFHADNLGYWLWEARSTGIFSYENAPAMQFLMRVGNKENFPIVPIDFPTCGNHRGPDLIFGDE